MQIIEWDCGRRMCVFSGVGMPPPTPNKLGISWDTELRSNYLLLDDRDLTHGENLIPAVERAASGATVNLDECYTIVLVLKNPAYAMGLSYSYCAKLFFVPRDHEGLSAVLKDRDAEE